MTSFPDTATAGADVAALAYVRKLRKNNLIGSAAKPAEGFSGGAAQQSSGNILDWADKTFGQASRP